MTEVVSCVWRATGLSRTACNASTNSSTISGELWSWSSVGLWFYRPSGLLDLFLLSTNQLLQSLGLAWVVRVPRFPRGTRSVFPCRYSYDRSYSCTACRLHGDCMTVAWSESCAWLGHVLLRSRARVSLRSRDHTQEGTPQPLSIHRSMIYVRFRGSLNDSVVDVIYLICLWTHRSTLIYHPMIVWAWAHTNYRGFMINRGS